LSSVDKDFLKEISDDTAGTGSFAALTSRLKVRLYRQNGATIEKGVIIEKGSVLLCHNIKIEEQSFVGPNCRFECEELRIGKMVQFNGGSEILGRKVSIGDVSYFEKGVLIGLGGSRGPNSEIQIGKMCFIGMGCQLNISEPIFIGDETCIGVRSILLTHSAWQNPLEGYPVKFGPISVGSNVWIGTDCFVLPRVTIADGATIAPKSVATKDILNKGLYGGSPAICIKDFLQQGFELSDEDKDAYIRSVLEDLKGVLNFHFYLLANETIGEQVFLKFEKDSVRYEFIYSFDLDLKLHEEIVRHNDSRKVIAFVRSNMELNHCLCGECLFDLEHGLVSGDQDEFSDEIRNLFRRRGIRFRPILWRYKEKTG